MPQYSFAEIEKIQINVKIYCRTIAFQSQQTNESGATIPQALTRQLPLHKGAFKAGAFKIRSRKRTH